MIPPFWLLYKWPNRMMQATIFHSLKDGTIRQDLASLTNKAVDTNNDITSSNDTIVNDNTFHSQ